MRVREWEEGMVGVGCQDGVGGEGALEEEHTQHYHQLGMSQLCQSVKVVQGKAMQGDERVCSIDLQVRFHQAQMMFLDAAATWQENSLKQPFLETSNVGMSYSECSRRGMRRGQEE